MSAYRSHEAPFRWLVLVAGAFVLVLLASFVVGYTGAGASPTLASPGQADGRPVAGPAATLRVVDLRTLPPASAASKPAGVLPFHSVGRSGTPPLNPRGDTLRRALAPDGYGAPQLVLGFDGINSEESGGSGGLCGCVPPDGDMAVGPNHVIVGVNQAFRVFNKSGTPLTGPVGFDSFFGSCGATGLTSSDPVTVYDPVADRFTVGILRYDSTTDASYVSLAVSQSNDPTTTWNQYCFLQSYQGIPSLYDFPHISVGQTALFTTGNLFPPGSEQQVSARANAYPKSLMYSGALTVTQVYTDVLFNSDNTQADTLRPALFNLGLPSPTSYFINVSSTPGSSRVSVWRWTDPFGANNFQLSGGVDVAPFAPAVPMLQPTPGQPMPPPAYIDSRTLAGMWYNGTLYSAHTIGCTAGSSVTDCIQWYQVGNLDGAPTLVQQGIVSGPNESRSYPNLAVDQYGDVELAYAYSSLTDFIGVRHTGRVASDPPGQMGPEGVIKAGEQAETGFNATRWGDYSGSVVDPSDGTTLWHFEEYSKNDPNPFGSWGTWASASRFSPPVLVGHVVWQGRPAQPSTLQELPITLTLRSGTTVADYPSQTTDATGHFTVTLTNLPAGVYNWRVKGPKYLANSGTFTLAGGTNTVEMGTMRVGDSNNDNVVNTQDFTILRATFGKACSDPGYDDRAEFTGDCRVNVTDFSLQRSNFGMGGGRPRR